MFHNTCTQSWDHVCLYYVSILPDLQSYWIEPSSGTSLKGEPLKIESSASSIGIFILFLYYYIILALQIDVLKHMPSYQKEDGYSGDSVLR